MEQRPNSSQRSWSFLFHGFSFREKLLGPVLVNLFTALILFLSVAMFRDAFYSRILPKPRLDSLRFPISCSVDMYNDSASGVQLAEIYIANVVDKSYSGDELKSLLNKDRPEGTTRLDALIEVHWTRDSGRMWLEDDKSFNDGKGKLEIAHVSEGGKKGTIRVLDINRKALLRVVARTNYGRPIKRGEFVLPISVGIQADGCFCCLEESRRHSDN